MKKGTKDAINNGMIRRTKRGEWEINTDFLRRQDDGRWNEVHIGMTQELDDAYNSGDLNIAPDGRASFR